MDYMIDPSEVLRTARRSAGLSVRDVSELADRAVSTVSRVESGETDPSVRLFDMLLNACGWRLTASPIDPESTPPREEPDMPTPPTTYSNPRNNNPWDDDTVRWMLEQPGVAAAWKYGPLFECLRRQPGRVRREPQRVEQAAQLARQLGIIQKDVYDPEIGKHVVRLLRTDPAAPRYPW